MREEFIQSINSLNEITKKDLESSSVSESSNESELIESEIPEELQIFLEKNLGGKEAADEIRKIQLEKRKIMEEVKESLDLIKQKDEDGNYIPVSLGDNNLKNLASGEIFRDEKGKVKKENFLMYQKGGVEINAITEGQVLVSSMWDEDYRLGETVSKKFKRKYIFAKARERLRDLYDQQIVIRESKQSYNNTNYGNSYQAIAERYEENAEIEPGVMAEKMVLSFLTKITHDHDLPFRIKTRDVTIYDDVEYKIDFILEMKKDKDSSGVGIEEPEDRKDIGIQFTTANNKSVLHHKENEQLPEAKKRLEREGNFDFEKLVLVKLPMKNVVDIYNEWNETSASKRLPGGPDEAWSDEFKEKVFMTIVKNALGEEVAKESWQKISGEESEPDFKIAA